MAIGGGCPWLLMQMLKAMALRTENLMVSKYIVIFFITLHLNLLANYYIHIAKLNITLTAGICLINFRR